MAVTTISRFRLILWILSLLCFHDTLAELRIRSKVSRPASTSGRSFSGEFDVRPHLVSRQKDAYSVTQKPRRVRLLLQEDANSSNTEHVCSLQEEVADYLDAARRTWRIDGAALSAIDNDVQAIVNCTTEGDTLFFDVGDVIRPRTRITLPWNLTISAATGRTRRVNGLYPKAPRKATITCPGDGEGVFLVRSRSVLLANLRFENCSLRGLSGSEAIVQVENCQSTREQDAVQLHHVSFERNTVIDAAALSIKSPSCARLQLADFEFSDNECGGHCGVMLSHQNQLHDIRIRRNRFSDSAYNKSSAVFYGSSGSVTSIERMNATENECSLLHVEEGSLNVSDATFAENDMYNSGTSDARSCIRLTNAIAFIQDCQFRGYHVRTGSTVTATESNLTVIGCVFENNVADRAGAIHLAASSASIHSCHFSSNQAQISAGVLMASESRITVVDSSFEANKAAVDGGCFYLESASKISLIRSSASGNEARNGSVAFLDGQSIGRVSGSIFSNNSASSNGGSFCAKGSRLSIKRCRFENGTAESGGAISLQSGSSGRLVRCHLRRNSADQHGGAIHVLGSTLKADRCRFSEGEAERGGILSAQDSRIDIAESYFEKGSASHGGCVRLVKRSDADIRNTTMIACDARKIGGAVQLAPGSSGMFVNVTFTKNSAKFSGGALHLKTANASLVRCRFAEDRTDHSAEHQCRFGGFVYSHLDSYIAVNESVMEDGEATEDGGCLFAQNTTLSMNKLTMIRCNASRNGGGLMVRDVSSADLDDIEIHSNRANHGAGIYVEESSVIGHGWNAKDNDAFRAGGLYVLRSSVLLKDSIMQNNTAASGGALSLSEDSVGVLFNVTFRRNSAEGRGGSCDIEDSELVIQKCHIIEGSAEHGGGISTSSSRISIQETAASNLAAAKYGGVISGNASEIRMRACSVFNNVAALRGGVVKCHSNCSFTDKESQYSRNSAEFGGVIDLKQNCSGSISGSKFEKNNASAHGGAVYLEESTFSVKQCRFSESSARWGGFIYSTKANLIISNSFFEKGSATEGGCATITTQSEVVLQDVQIASCKAQLTGGAVQLLSNSVGIFRNVFLEANSAQLSGGSFFVRESTSQFDYCSFRRGQAQTGGLLTVAAGGSADMRHSSLQRSTAEWGACVRCEGGSIVIENVTMEECRAEFSGGAIRMAFTSTATIRDSTFVRNSGKTGGGIALLGKTTVFGDSLLFEDNTAEEGGGALAAEQASTIDVNSSVFQNNAGRDGGVLIQSWNTTVIFTKVVFDSNQATRYGGIVYAIESSVSFDRCVFKSCRAEHGGFLYSRKSKHCYLNRTVVVNGSALTGGCITIETGNLALQGTSMQNCTASNNGGALHLWEGANVTVTDSNITTSRAGEHGGGVYMSQSSLSANGLLLTDNTAEGDGGGIFSEDSSIGTINDSHVQNNSARSGGGLVLRNTTGSMIRVRISGNSASDRGGACCMESSSLRVARSTIRDSHAVHGGSFFVQKSKLELTNSKLEHGRASLEGGFISSIENSSIKVDTTSMILGASIEGGAVFLSKSVCEAVGIQVSQCEAEYDGGAIVGIDSSRMLCDGCTLVGNSARRGGAIYFQYNDTRTMSMQLDNCTVQNNSAVFGGGVQIVAGSESVFQDCRARLDECEATAMVNTVFTNNEAQSAGGAIFIDTVAGLQLRCSDESAGKGQERYPEKHWTAMKRLTSIDDICTSWENNSADRYGPDVASYVSDVQKKIADTEIKGLIPPDRNRYIIGRHKSGKPILVAFTPVDDLEQSPAVGENNEDIEAVMSSPDRFIVGSMRVPLNDTVVNVSTTGLVQPGEYRVIIKFEGASLESFEIIVDVKTCEMGEVPSANGAFCEPCSDATYSFEPDREDLGCLPCPKNGRCNTSTIRPLPGYWHRWPCSSHLQKCLTDEACDFDQREEKLYELTKDLHSCDIADDLVDDYGDAQCRKGHTGPLCGSCKPDYGKAQFFACEECFSDAANVLLYLLSILVFLILAAIAMKANLEPDDQNPGSKKIVVEVFKIAVDYAQVTAIAISINVSWSTTLSRFFEIAEFISGVITEAIERTVHCLLPKDAVIERAIFGVTMDVVTVFGVFLLFCAFWGIVAVIHRADWHYLWKRVWMSFCVVSYLGYISLTSTSIHILTCLEVHDSLEIMNDSTTAYWAADTNIQCHEGSHAVLKHVLGWPLLVVFSFGFPVAILYITYFADRQRRNQGDRREILGFLYQTYKERYCYWESVVLLRKAALAVVVMLAHPLGPSLQVMFSAFVFTVALYLQTVCRPFGEDENGQNGQRDELDRLNDLESTSLLVTLLTFVSSLCFNGENVSSGIRLSVSLVILALNLVFFSYLVVIFVGKCVDRWRTDPNKQPITSGSSSDEP